MQDSKQVVTDSLNHRQPSRVAVDFGGTSCSGIHCSVVADLRKHFKLSEHPIKVIEQVQMLGEIEDDLADVMGVDVVWSLPINSSFGNPNDADTKEWKTPWGQVVLMPSEMVIDMTPEGDAVTYPQGDRSAGVSGRMPASGHYFDSVIRQGEFDEDDPNPNDNTEEFVLLTDSELARIAKNAEKARARGRAVTFMVPGASLGDISLVPGIFMKNPKGIRDITEWYISLAARQDFIHAVFDKQTGITIENLKKIVATVGPDAYDAVFACGTDFGTQIGTFVSRDTFDELYLPYYKRINNWIHENTSWKTIKHSCGAIDVLIPGFIESGFDALNPVQCSASGMDPEHLKKAYGDKLTFWGGGANTQQTLPFGTPEEVRAEVLERCRIFAPDGGFIFDAIHNVQRTPVENMIALLDAVKEFNTAGK